MIEKTYRFLKHYFPQLEMEVVKEGESIETSLFSNERLILIDGVEKWKGEELKKLIQEVMLASPKTRFALGGESVPSSLYVAVEQNLVCLDLSGEKPWDRKKRLLEEGMQIGLKMGKRISIPVMEEIVLRVGEDLGSIKNEVEKLALYQIKKQEITLEEVALLTKERLAESSWRIAEGVVLGEAVEDPECRDLSDLFGLFGQIRFFLYIGLELAEQMEKGVPLIHTSLKKGQIEKWASFVARVGSSYFTKAICTLFEREVEAKTFFVNPSVLWDRIVIQFSHDITLITQSSRSHARS
jgi:DNA polymerase III delta subunit